MSSWFGNGLSQITGQISNFTKEVLEEGTGEVDDHVTQLKITKKHLLELDHHSQAQRAEIERLKRVNDDLEEKLQTSELQNSTISNQYRQILEKKETEIQDLRRQQNDADESRGSLEAVSGMSHSASAPSLTAGFSDASDHDDFGDLITSQHEINRLRGENKRLESECSRWKQLTQANTGSKNGDDSEQIHQLQDRLKELQQRYDDELDNHQRELAALHDVHAQKVATLKRRNNELSKQQATSESPKDNGRRGSSEGRSPDVVGDKLRHMDKVNQKLTFDLDLIHAADREKARQLQELQAQYEGLQLQLAQLSEEKVAVTTERDELMQQLDVVVAERRSMSEQIGEMSTKVKELERQRQDVSVQQSSPGGSAVEAEVESLREQLSDWQMEKEALEDVLLKLRGELRESQQTVATLQNQAGQPADSTKSQSDGGTSSEAQQLKLLTEQIDQQKQKISDLLAEAQQKDAAAEKLRLELQTVKTSLQQESDRVSKLQEALQQGSEEESSKNDHLTAQQEQLQAEVVDLQTQTKEWQKRHEGATSELQLLTDKLRETQAIKDEVEKEVTSLKESNKQLSSENADLQNNLAKEEEAASLSGLQKLIAEKDAMLENLTAERDSLVESLEELDSQHSVALEQMIKERQKLTREVDTLKAKILDQDSESSSKETEKENTLQELCKEVEVLKTAKEKAEASIQFLNSKSKELEATKATLEDGLKSLEDRLQTVSLERDELKHNCDQLQKKLQVRGEEASQLAADLATLKQEFSKSKAVNQKLQLTIESLEQSAANPSGTDLEPAESAQVSTLRHTVEGLQKGAEDAEKSWSSQIEELRRQNKEAVDESDRLRQSEAQLREQLNQAEVRLQDCAPQMEELVTLQSKHDELLSDCQQKKSAITQLEDKVSLLQSIAEENLSDTFHSGEATPNISQQKASDSQNTELETAQKQLAKKEEEILNYQREIDTLQETITGNKQLLDAAASQQQTLNSQVGDLQSQLAAKDAAISELRQCQLDSDKSDNTDASPNRERLKENALPNGSDVIHNGDIKDDNVSTTVDELDKLRKLIAQKDLVITQLNDNNSSLLKLLEDRSQASFGDNTLVELHQLQSQVKGLRMEKDQMISVLNEKTRECSSLKAEVHRLMNVVSAEKSAICKLQQDNEELLKASAVAPTSQPELGDEEMTKEAIRKLSQMVRDKDMEMQALSQKNYTLLQVLQETSTEGARISTLMQEKDNLSKQVAMFQTDRDNIISALNQKHQESIAYHSEIQRLSALVSTEAQRHEKLENDFTGLQQQYEYKQQALVKLQNELLNYKQKFTQADQSLKELQRKKESMEMNKSEDAPSLDTTTVNSDELDGLRATLRERETDVAEKNKQLEQRQADIREKERKILASESTISEKDKTLADLHTKLHRTNESLHSRDSELNTLKKQVENITFQLHGLQTEIADLRVERDQLYDRNSVLQQELGAIKEHNNRLTIQLNDKEFEISSSKEKTNTLSKLIQDTADKEKGQVDQEVDRLITEAEVVQTQMQALKHERDQGLMAIQQQQTENQQLRNQIERLQQKHDKLVKELDRLRSHLLAIEENYTQEAVAAEEREKQLRNRLAAAEEKVLSSSSAVQIANQQALQQVDALQTELHAVTGQRDSALLQLSSAQETSNQYATSLHNLQMVLEQFQLERETQQNAEIERYQKENNGYRREVHQLREKIRDLEAQANETTDALEAAQRLSEQLDRKEQTIAALREEVQLRESELRKTEDEVRALSVSKEARVDKDLVKNLIIGYFHAPPSKRKEALHLIGRMLEFTPADMEQLSSDVSAQRGWLRGLFRKSAPTPPSTPKAGSPNQSFSELFVTFLERESSPQPSLRLPTDRMISESQRRTPHSPTRPAPAFNPFATPVATSLPMPAVGHGGQAINAVHPLIRPSEGPPLPGSNLLVAPPSANDPFYQSMPTNSGAILRDVLHQ